ncbi:CPBP family intramembrane metalloprotease [Chitinophagaceae bacterium 26-R-25]|nr:CPBP family intramembrane metalloprotease [Chitinophagaceae bacterium 26-R-25]
MNNPYYLIFFYSISYFSFAILLWLSKAKQGLRLFDDSGFVANPSMLILLHAGGIILFLFPLLFSHFNSFILFSNDDFESPAAWVTIICFLLLLFISPKIAQKKYSKSGGNVLPAKLPGIHFIILYFIVRILFICVYESWFRGYLLSDSISSLGWVLAVLLNVILYALLHIVNGKDEVISCFPFGILLCCLCIWQGAVWPAIVLHLALTLPYEISLLKKMYTNKQQPHENFSNGSFRVSR